jgi:hypothetical protein
MEDRLKCYSAGVLEVQANIRLTGTSEAHKAEAAAGRVQFLHRTVRDYLEQPDAWDALLVYTNGTAFSPDASLLKARILYLKLVEHSDRGLGLLEASIICMTHAHHAEIDTGKSYTLLLDELDGTVASYCTQARPYHWSHLVSGYRNLQAPKDSFLSLAVQFGLDLCVQQKLQEVGLEERSKQVEPLLGYAMRPY